MSIVSNNLKQSIIWRGFYFITLLLVNIVLSRFLKAEGAGVIFYLANLFSFGVLIFSFNLDGGFTFFSSSKLIKHHQLANLAVVWTIFFGLITYFFLPIYFSKFDEFVFTEVNKASINGLYYIVGILLFNFFTALFYSLGNFVLPNIILGVTNLLLVALIYFGIKANFSSTNIINYYFQFITFQGVAVVIAYYLYYKILPSFQFPSCKEFKELFRYSSISLVGNFLFFFVYRLDYWFVKEFGNNIADLGNYIQSSKLSQLLLIAPQILASSIFPQLASGKNQEEIVETISRLCRIFSIIFLAIFIIVLILGKWLFPFVFGSSFSNMYLPILILLPGIFCLSSSALLSAYFSGRKQNHINLYAAAFALMVMVAFTIIFKSQYTIYVAATISSIAYFAETLFCFYHYSKKASIHWKTIFNYSINDWVWLKKLLFN